MAAPTRFAESEYNFSLQFQIVPDGTNSDRGDLIQWFHVFEHTTQFIPIIRSREGQVSENFDPGMGIRWELGVLNTKR
jgi:hypothetical protein